MHYTYVSGFVKRVVSGYITTIYIYIYIYTGRVTENVIVCVYVCVCVRERERERERAICRFSDLGRSESNVYLFPQKMPLILILSPTVGRASS